jgi:hypothetical protein
MQGRPQKGFVEALGDDPLRPGSDYLKPPNPRQHGPKPDVTLLPEVDPGAPGFYTQSEFIQAAQITYIEYRKLTARRALVARFRIRGSPYVVYDDSDVDAVMAIVKKHREKVAEAEAKIGRRDPVRRGPAAKERPPPFSTMQARKVIRLLKQGKPQDEILLATDIHPDTIILIARTYERMINTIFLTGDQIARINKMSLEGIELPIRTSVDLVNALQAVADRKCDVCHEASPSGACARCIKRRVIVGLEKRAAVAEKMQSAIVKAKEADERMQLAASSNEAPPAPASSTKDAAAEE